MINVCPGRRRKPASFEGMRKVTLQVEENKASDVHANASILRVAEAVDLLQSTVQSIMWSILWYYPYKFQFVQKLLPNNFKARHRFSLQFLARFDVDSECP